MKSYVLATFLCILAAISLLVAGCGGAETAEQTTEAAATPVLDEVTNADAVGDDLSLDSEEDDYGDII